MDMPKSVPLLLLALTLLSAACAAPPHTVVAPPVHQADLYPDAQSIAGLTVAVDEISDPERARLYFGRDVTSEDILPVMVVVTNQSDDRFLVKPSDVLVYRGKTIVDPVPPPRGTAGPEVFKETVVAPGSTVQGIIFYKIRKQEPGLYGKVERVFSDRPMLRMIATDQESGERISFGPFTLSGL